MESKIIEAIEEVKDALMLGLSFDKAVMDIADEHGIPRVMLTNRAKKAILDPAEYVANRQNFEQSTSPDIVFAAKVQVLYEHYLKEYGFRGGEARSTGTVFTYKGGKYTYVGSFTNNRHIVLRHSDGQDREVNTPWLQHSTFEAEFRRIHNLCN